MSKPCQHEDSQGESLIITPEGSTIVTRMSNGDSKHVSSFSVAPAPVIDVVDELVSLSTERPNGWAHGTRLLGMDTGSINAKGAFISDSLVMRRAPGGQPLISGRDYLIDAEFGMVGIGPDGTVAPDETVFASYSYAAMRLDTVGINDAGELMVQQGKPHLTTPLPAELPSGFFPRAHIFRHDGAIDVQLDDIFPLLENASCGWTGTTPNRIPRTLAKMCAFEPVTIVCWGDSVTNGGDASRPETRYVDLFAAGLRAQFPAAPLEVVNVSVDGSGSLQWLFPDEYPPVSWQHGIDFSRLTVIKPDLITVEFVNDAGLSIEQTWETYAEILRRFDALQAESIFIAPHFTHPAWMGFTSIRDEEARAYVLELRAFADRHQVALADVSSRWQHLWREGIPYLTLLRNSLNHPDDRGHRLFAEELWKCWGLCPDAVISRLEEHDV